jgi:L-aspartate oxidase
VPFMLNVHPLADLAPRDIVARAIHERMQRANTENVWLDATMIPNFEEHFPTIWAACQSVGLDPHDDWLPVAPAAHYLSGGVVTDLDGATSLSHLWACGETACSGVHGANRLASNSLLDGLVFGRRVVEAIISGQDEASSNGAMAGVRNTFTTGAAEPDPIVLPKAARERVTDPAELLTAVQRVMSSDCGVLRDAEVLERADETLRELGLLAADLPARIPATYEVCNVLRVARAIVSSALARLESRGSHFRRDYPKSSDDYLGRFVTRGGRTPAFVELRDAAVGERR